MKDVGEGSASIGMRLDCGMSLHLYLKYGPGLRTPRRKNREWYSRPRGNGPSLLLPGIKILGVVLLRLQRRLTWKAYLEIMEKTIYTYLVWI
jgi:hypothetical protein